MVTPQAESPGLEGAGVAAAAQRRTLRRARRELLKDPVAHGWRYQTWTLSRIKALIGRRFHKSYTVQGVAALLRRHGWTCQVPARRAVERDESALAGWGRRPGRRWKGRGGARRLARLEDDEAGFSMTPPTTRTWSRPRTHPRSRCPGPIPPPLIRRRPGLLQAW